MNTSDVQTSNLLNGPTGQKGQNMAESTRKTCTTCCRPADAPYRRIIAGKIVEGCVSADHDGKLPAASNTSAWHNRKEAKALRTATRNHLASMGIRP